MTTTPMQAAERVAAFLNRRAQMSGLDPVDITGLDGGHAAGGTAITVPDLTTVVSVLGGLREAAERAERHGYDLDPADVLELLGVATP